MVPENLQQLEARLNQIGALDNYALCQTQENRYEIVKLTWCHRIIRFFRPNKYDAIQILPRISPSILSLSEANAQLVDYKKITNALEFFFSKDFKSRQTDIARSVPRQQLANIALLNLVTLRDKFLPFVKAKSANCSQTAAPPAPLSSPTPPIPPTPTPTPPSQEPVLPVVLQEPMQQAAVLKPLPARLQGSDKMSHEEFLKVFLEIAKDSTDKAHFEPLAEKAVCNFKELPLPETADLIQLWLELRALKTRLGVAQSARFDEFEQLFRNDVEGGVKYSLGNLLKNPCDNPGNLLRYLRVHATYFGAEARAALLQANSSFVDLAEKMYAMLQFKQSRMGDIAISESAFRRSAVASPILTAEEAACETHIPHLKAFLEHIADYDTLALQFKNEPYDRLFIQNKSFEGQLAIPGRLKLALFAEELVRTMKEVAPATPDEMAISIACQIVSLTTTTEPAPLSVPKAFEEICRIVQPARNGQIQENPKISIIQRINCFFKEEKGILVCELEVKRGFSFVGDGKPIQGVFSAKIHKNFSDSNAAWRGQMRALEAKAKVSK